MVSNLGAPAALLDGKLLLLFDWLYRTRSVSRSAEAMGQAQPTASIWLARLRKELGDPLFVRTGSGLEPTPRADALIGPARSAIAMLQRLGEPDEAFVPQNSERCFRICMTDASHITLLPLLLRKLRIVGPGIRIEVPRIDSGTAKRLSEAEADIAIGLVPDLEAGFYQQTLYTQDWICLANARHPRLDAALTRSAYEAEGHVVIAYGTGHRLLDEAVRAADIRRRVMLELPGFLGLAGVVAATDLLATLPRQIGETLARANKLKVLSCPFAIPSFTVKLHWHERYHNEPGHRWLRGLCTQLFQRA